MELIARIRRVGFPWILDRTVREAFAPTTKLGIRLRPITAPFATLLRPLFSIGRERGLGNRLFGSDTLVFFYDLEVCPISYDFAAWLMHADMRRRELGLARLHVCFVPGKTEGLSIVMPAYEAAVSADSRRWRLHNICVAFTQLLPSCAGYTLCGSRAEAAALLPLRPGRCLPEDYDPIFPRGPDKAAFMQAVGRGNDPKALRVPAQGRTYVRQWIATHAQDRKVIAITVRDYKFHPGRNSNKAAWSAFARQLDPGEFCVVIIPDTDRAMDADDPEFAGFLHFREACWNIALRAAIYEAAWLNLGASGGPAEIWNFIPAVRYIVFKMLVQSVPTATREKAEAEGFVVGQTPSFAGRFQKWVWDPDDLPVIEREFTAIAPQIRAANL